MLRVLAFGGNALGTASNLQQLTHIVAHQTRQQETFPLVVISAPSGVPDQLLTVARLVRAGKRLEWIAALEQVKQRYRDCAGEAIHDPARYHALTQTLETVFLEMDQDLLQLQLLPYGSAVVPLQTMHFIAWGERLAVLIIAAALEDAGIASTPVQEAVIVTAQPRIDEGLANGMVTAPALLTDTRAHASRLLLPILGQQVVPVIAGVMARSRGGTMTSLGAHGAEYAAALLAVALHAFSLTLYTEHAGILSADPRLVSNAVPLPALSYDEASALLASGQQALHPHVLPLLASHQHIPLQVHSLLDPQKAGTLISAGPSSAFTMGVALQPQVALIRLKKRTRVGHTQALASILQVLTQTGISPLMLHMTASQNLSVLIEDRAVDAVCQALEDALEPWEVRCQRGLAACLCVGSGFGRQPLTLAYAMLSLLEERIPVISQGFAESGLVLVVNAEDGARALRCLHRDFVLPVLSLRESSSPDDSTVGLATEHTNSIS